MLLSLNDGTQVGPVSVGLPEYAVSTIVNSGTTPQRITKISGPGAPFSARFLPRLGTVLRPGQSLTVQFAYTPKPGGVLQLGAHHHRQQRHTSEDQPVRRERAGRQQVHSAPQSISFGDVPVGQTATRFIHIVNSGNRAALVAATTLAGPFRDPDRVAPGLPVNGGYDLSSLGTLRHSIIFR